MKLLLPLLAVTVVIVGYFALKELILTQHNKQNLTTSTYVPSNLKTFESTTMKFTVEVPATYEVVEKSGAVAINTSNGSIYIDRNTSNLTNLNDYVKDLRSKNRVRVISEKYLSISNNEALTTIIDSGDSKETKEYMIYASNWVYLISTSSPLLYSDLDQIAQSFRYTPN